VFLVLAPGREDAHISGYPWVRTAVHLSTTRCRRPARDTVARSPDRRSGFSSRA